MHTALSLKVITPHGINIYICIVSFDSRNALNEKT